MESFLKFRVRFLLNQFFKHVLLFYGLTVYQVTLNRWAYMIGLYVLFTDDPPLLRSSSGFTN